MSGALAATKDREAALLRFAGTLDGDDLTALRRALGGTTGRRPVPSRR
ncbi:hypothetical protein BC477_01950 [Clavibacter michiganensis subsp. michiganensis]|uniref:Uncharacterized protein n=1 Tax=Clavibacter michiganensis subsp. michiganensis TaxID=33013 RepID=A0A251XIZ8_CLAMM|nr:hypothetical protein BC477_01950 [Clavibacter michiganensis subsp. michiganensis]OUE03472.1 hypothetical protein CMMCAS07_00885 [Clavibacter michiganensis subsp. michiganensis]